MGHWLGRLNLYRTKAQKWIFDENAALRNTQFEFKDKENPQGYVTSLSSELHDTPMNDLLKVHSKYKHALEQKLLSDLHLLLWKEEPQLEGFFFSSREYLLFE